MEREIMPSHLPWDIPEDPMAGIEIEYDLASLSPQLKEIAKQYNTTTKEVQRKCIQFGIYMLPTEEDEYFALRNSMGFEENIFWLDEKFGEEAENTHNNELRNNNGDLIDDLPLEHGFGYDVSNNLVTIPGEYRSRVLKYASAHKVDLEKMIYRFIKMGIYILEAQQDDRELYFIKKGNRAMVNLLSSK